MLAVRSFLTKHKRAIIFTCVAILLPGGLVIALSSWLGSVYLRNAKVRQHKTEGANG